MVFLAGLFSWSFWSFRLCFSLGPQPARRLSASVLFRGPVPSCKLDAPSAVKESCKMPLPCKSFQAASQRPQSWLALALLAFHPNVFQRVRERPLPKTTARGCSKSGLVCARPLLMRAGLRKLLPLRTGLCKAAPVQGWSVQGCSRRAGLLPMRAGVCKAAPNEGWSVQGCSSWGLDCAGPLVLRAGPRKAAPNEGWSAQGRS